MSDLSSAAPMSLGLACLLDLAIFLWALIAGRQRAGELHPALPFSTQQRMALLGAVPIVMLGAAALLALPASKGPWVAASIAGGGLLMTLLSAASILLEGATWQESVVGRLALALLVLAGSAALAGPILEPEQAVNMWLGLLLGMAAMTGAGYFLTEVLHARALATARTGATIVLGGTASLVGALAWGTKSLPDHGIGAAFPHLLAAVLLLVALTMSALLPATGARRGQLIKAALGAALGGGITLLLLQFLYRLPLLWLAPVGMGLLLPLLWAAISPEMPDQVVGGMDLPWTALVYVLSGGGAILLANRLGGAYGVALCGLSLLTAAPLRRHGWGWLEALLAVMASRSLIQLYLERTYLTHYGVDLTHAYAFAALALGLSFPLAVAVAQGLWQSRLWLAAWAISFLLHVPLLLGFFLHIEPVAAFQEGMLAIALLLGFLCGLPEGLLPAWLYGAVSALPSLLIGTTVVALLSAPWAIQVANTERLLRFELFALLGGAVLLLAWLGGSQRARGPAGEF